MKQRNVSEARKRAVALVGYGDQAVGPFLELTKDLSESSPGQVLPANIHIGIDVNDLRALCSLLQRKGVPFIRPLAPIGRPGSRDLRAWISDPDGNQLELAERYPN